MTSVLNKLKLLIFVILLIVIGSCEKENNPPSINSITANPQVLGSGESSYLVCNASDPDGDSLSYFWSTSNGTFPSVINSETTVWMAPNELGVSTITVQVDDGSNIVEGFVNIDVQENPVLSVTPVKIDFGKETLEYVIEIKNTGTGTLSWELVEEIEWLALDKRSGSTTSETNKITAIVDRSILDIGTYEDQILVTSNGGGQSIATTIEIPKIMGEFKDPRDGRAYKTVQIGEQVWMAENLAYLPRLNSSTWGSDTEPYYYVNGYDSGESIEVAKGLDSYKSYGVLYNYEAAKIACPSGWHLPTDDEWKELELAIGMDDSEINELGKRGTVEGGLLKTTSGWSNNGNGVDRYGFSALPGGELASNGPSATYNHGGIEGNWWTSTENEISTAWIRVLGYESDGVGRGWGPKRLGLSVRCVKD